MIKKISAVLLSSVLVLALAACGNSDYSAKYSLKDTVGYEPLDYVKLGNYTGISVDLTTDENLELIENGLSYYTGTQITDRAVADGDTVNIAFAGRYKSSGEAFDGGTSDSYDLTIGSGQFIPGFEDKLIGVTPGQTVDLDLTFPDTYQNADLAGVPVIFTVTVHYIIGHTDEELKIAQNSVAAAALLTEIVKNSTFTEDLPEDAVQEQTELIIQNLTETASYYGMTLEEYLSAAYSTTEEQIRTEAATYAEEQVMQDIAMYAIAEVDNITLSDEQYESMLKTYALIYGYESPEEFVSTHGEESIRKYLLSELVFSHLVDVNNVKR